LSGASVTVYIGPSESRYINFLKKRKIDICHMRPLDEIFSKRNGIDFLVSNDTGLMHVGCALGLGAIAIFICTSPEVWFPYFLKNQGYIKRRISSECRFVSSPSVHTVFKSYQNLRLR